MKAKYFWPGWRKSVEIWCKTCPECVKRKSQIPTQRAKLHGLIPGFPFQRIASDVTGPFPITARGNRYILVVQDYYTKWVEAYAIPNQEAKTVAQKLVDEFICRFGVPFSLHTDQGRNFEAKIFQEMCMELGIEKTRTSPYHPMSDGLVEHFNRTLGSMLSQYVEDSQADWDIHLPKLMMAFRCGEQESTGFSPNFLVFGRETSLPVELLAGVPCQEESDIPTFVKNALRSFTEAFSLVNSKLQESHYKQKLHYDKRSTNRDLKVGDQVWLFNNRTKKGRCRKLVRPWVGPCTIIKQINPVVFRVSRTCNGHQERKVVHMNHLKKIEHVREVNNPQRPPQVLSTTPVASDSSMIEGEI